MGKKKDLTGMKFGKLTALTPAGKCSHGKLLWLCECECGNRGTHRTGHLMSGSATQCRFCPNTTHGHTKGKEKKGVSPTYKSWRAMIQRCTESSNIGYKYYGALGTSVCERWLESFENFLADMGERPKNKSLDRIDPFGNYEPTNCRWATSREQAMNKKDPNRTPWNKGMKIPFKSRKKRTIP